MLSCGTVMVNVMKKTLISKMVMVNGFMIVMALAVTCLIQMGDWKSVAILVGFLLLTTIVQVIVVTRYLNEYFVRALSDVNQKMKEITHGNLDARVEAKQTEEFAELSGHINDMVKSILETTDKISVILDNVDIPIGVYEYGTGMSRVRATKQVANILFFDEQKAERYLADNILFADYLDAMRSHPFDEEKHIYQVLGEEPRYVKMETFREENSVFGAVTDVTESVVEQLRMELEKREDALTGLPSRNVMYEMLDECFQKKQTVQNSVLILLDVVNLRKVNEDYGLETGDGYLCKVAELLKKICPQKSLLTRLSNGEFLLFIHSCENQWERDEFLEILQKKNGASVCLEDDTMLILELAMGYAYFGEDGTDYHDMMKIADERMSDEKRFLKEKN